MPSKYVAKPKTKRMPCRYCGVSMIVGWKRKRLPAHDECISQRVADNARQISGKSGPYYENWRDGMLRAIERETMARGVPLENVDPCQD